MTKKSLLWDLSPLVLLLPLAARLSVAFERATRDGILFPGPDAYYHTRRILSGVETFPQVLSHDYGLTVGTQPMFCPWPPLFDFVGTLFTLPWSYFYSDRVALETIVALLPPVLGIIAIVMLFALLRNRFSLRVAVVGALLLSFLPAHLNPTLFAAVDHHAAEPLIILLLLWLAPILSPQRGPRETGLRLMPYRLFFAGAVAGLSCMVAQVAWLYCMILAFFLMLQANCHKRTLAGASGLLFGVLFASLWQIGHGGPTWSYETLSLLHPTLIAIAPCYILLIGHLRKTIVAIPSRALRLILFSSVMLLIGLLPMLIDPLREALFAGAGFLGRNPVIALIAESRPFFHTPAATNGYLGYAVYLVPLLLLIDLRRCPLYLNLFTGVLMLLTVMQLRFAAAFSILVAILLARHIDLLLNRFRIAGWRYGMAVTLFTILNFFPFMKAMTFDLRAAPSPYLTQNAALADWIRQQTPGPKAVPENPPDYRVLAPWHLGHLILHRGERAVVANPFIFDRQTPGLMESLRTFYQWDEEQLYAYARRHRIRYVVFQPILNDTARNLQVVGEPLADFLVLKNNRHLLTARFRDSLMVRYGFAVPSEVGRMSGARHLRLIYETPMKRSPFAAFDSPIKVYEIVEGATVFGVFPEKAGQEVNCSVQLEAGHTKRQLLFHWEAELDERGRFELRLPYANSGTLTPYRLRFGDGTEIFFVVHESLVQQGGRFNLFDNVLLPTPDSSS